ncbi:MAG: hypothetical protein WAL37_13130 [Xanthobacteraceae bacterium]|jgi:uncharacterized protein
MTMNDLTAPLGQDPNRHRRAINLSVGKIIAVALGLFFGAFVLWAVIAQDRSGGEPMAVAPADLRFAKKGTEVVAVPQATAPADSKEPATTAALRPSPPAKPPSGVTVTIIDGKTGAKREVIVASPPQAATAAERVRPDQNGADTTDQVPRKR